MIARRSLIGFAVTSIATARAQSTPPTVTPDRVRALLASEKINERAWGAYHAGAMGLTTEAPFIASLLHEALEARLQDGAPWHLPHFIELLADAAIRLRCPLPAKPLLALATYWRNYLTLILIQFMPTAQEKEYVLLTLLDRRPKGREGDTVAWTAIGNYLLALRSSRWAVRLLREVDIAHRFQVVDGSHRLFGSRLIGGTGDWAWGAWPKDFPPRVLHYLTFDPNVGGVLIAPGPRNVYAVRQESSPDQPPPPSPGLSGEFGVWQKPRIEYLAALTATKVSELERLFQQRTEVDWQDVAALQENIARETALQIKAIREFARRLARSGITGLEGLPLQVLIEIEDSRQSKEVPLPAVPPRTFTLP
ncbi:MAG TPA: hypothetical protein DCY80_10160 [Solibacterales bacterium]|nr:hypothetical protein [Bryobacterales bacterium]